MTQESRACYPSESLPLVRTGVIMDRYSALNELLYRNTPKDPILSEFRVVVQCPFSLSC
jgi:hypothetical protein